MLSSAHGSPGAVIAGLRLYPVALVLPIAGVCPALFVCPARAPSLLVFCWFSLAAKAPESYFPPTQAADAALHGKVLTLKTLNRGHRPEWD